MSTQDHMQTELTASEWPDWKKQIVAVLLILLVPVTIYFLRPVMPAIIATIGIAFVLMYAIRPMQKYLKLSYGVSAGLMYFLFLIISLTFFIWFIGSAVTGLINTLTQAEQFLNETLADFSNQESAGSIRDLLRQGKSVLMLFNIGTSVISSPSTFFAEIGSKFSAFVSFFTNYALVLTVLPFFLFEWPRTRKAISSRFDPVSRREYGILVQRSMNLGQNFVLGSLLVALFYWLLATVQFALTGIPHSIALGFVVGMPNFIPQVGGMISAGLVFVLVLMAGSNTIAMNVLSLAFVEMAVFMLISGVTYYFIDARIYAKSVRMPIWVILIGIVAFSAAFGVVGAIFAAAAVAIMGEILDFIIKKMRGLEPYPEEVGLGEEE